MKAQTVLKNKILAYYDINKSATFEDIPLVVFHEAMKDYARIQIEKDRERVIDNIMSDFDSTPDLGLDIKLSVLDTLITLD